MAKLRGADDLRKRIRALGVSFKPIGRKWGRETVTLSRPQIPIRTGKTRRSLRVRHANMKRATVYGSFVAAILDKGAKAHTITPRKGSRLVFQSGGNTIFARKVNHRGVRGSRYAGKAAREALRRVGVKQELIDAWNRGD
jgi:hypothetical protein